MKWWRRIFWRMIDHIIVNAYVIYIANNSSLLEKSKTRVQFRLELAELFSQPAIALRRGPGRNPGQILPRLTGKHFPYRTSTRKRCVVCAYKKTSPRGTKYRDTKVMTWCPKCEVHLCIGTCFECYHTRVNYKH